MAPANPSSRPLRLLVVRCGDPHPGVSSAHGDYVRWFRDAIDPAVELRVRDPREERPVSAWLDGMDGVVLTGSPHGVYEPHAWIAPLESFVRDAIERETPMLGVCFGHQLIARACGGRVVKNARGREIGTVEVTRLEGAEHALLDGVPARFLAQAIHGDTVVEPPRGARVLARSSRDDCQAMANGSAWSVQFHPEVTPAILRACLEQGRARYLDEGIDVDAQIASLRESDTGAGIFARFLDWVRNERAAREAEGLEGGG